MKKNNLLLVAGAAMLLTGCGTKYSYAHNIEEDGMSMEQTLTVKSKSFSINAKMVMDLNEEMNLDLVCTINAEQKGALEAIEDKENTYKLTTKEISYSMKLDGDAADESKKLLSSTLAFVVDLEKEDIEKLIDGEKVTTTFEESDWDVSYVVVNEEDKTFNYTYDF